MLPSVSASRIGNLIDDAPRMTPRRVLIVDDDESLVNTVGRILVRKGYEIQGALGASVARRILESGQAVPDVVLCDYRMPGEDGVTFLRDVRERWPWVQRILMTGSAE